jgi:16S rRNA (guanine527-N7)-methyltransferase
MALDLLSAFCRERGMALSPEQVALFEQYRDVLYRMNEVANLTRVPREDCEVRHFIDSLLVAEFVPQGARVLDVGTGPGLPAWPLACARPDLRVVAMDSTGKMLRVLGEVPLPNIDVRQHRAEEADARESFDFVTGRAVAPLSAQLELSAAWAVRGGLVVPFRTPNDAIVKLPQLGLKLKCIEERALPTTDVVRVFPIYRKERRTPEHYPRTWAQIKSSPLAPPGERGAGR